MRRRAELERIKLAAAAQARCETRASAIANRQWEFINVQGHEEIPVENSPGNESDNTMNPRIFVCPTKIVATKHISNREVRRRWTDNDFDNAKERLDQFLHSVLPIIALQPAAGLCILLRSASMEP